MKDSDHEGCNNLLPLSLDENMDDIMEEPDFNGFIYDHFISISEDPIFQYIYSNLSSKSKLSSRFKIFHLFSPKISESIRKDNVKDKDNNKDKDTIMQQKNQKSIQKKQKKQKSKKLFISRKKNRKEMKDNIIKKIKSRFFKNMKKILKERLKKKYNYEGKFKFLSQSFISDIKMDTNKLIWDQTFQKFMEEKSADNNNDKNDILVALQKDKICFMTLKEIFNEYLNSREFAESIPDKNKENNVDQKYIDDYIFYANNLINYYSQ